MIRKALWLSALLLLATTGVHAATPATVFVDELTSPELRDQVRAGKTTVIVPIGGTEQSGPHIVLGKHNVRVKILAEKIAQTLGNALVAPVMAYVPEGGITPPTAHMRFPGTITVPDAAFRSVLESVAKSFRAHGFRDIVFLGDHGDYQKSLNAIADRLNREWAATPVRAHNVEAYYRAGITAYGQALKSRGISNNEIGIHAGLADTSLSLAVDPRLVRIDRLEDGSKSQPANGVVGDPRRSSAELGQLGVEGIVAATVEAIKRAVVRN